MKKNARQTIMEEAGCTAKGGLLELGFIQWYSAARDRYLQGQRQKYCGTCGLCRFYDEAASCPRFTPSPEMDAFYEKEAKRKR